MLHKSLIASSGSKYRLLKGNNMNSLLAMALRRERDVILYQKISMKVPMVEGDFSVTATKKEKTKTG